MNPKIITPPAAVLSPVTARVHCRIDDNGEDARIADLIEDARQMAQHYTGVAIGAQMLELAKDAFPCGAIELPFGPVASVASLKYLDANGTEQTWGSSNYTLDSYSVPARVVPAAGVVWPTTTTAANAVNVVKLRYVTGSADLDASVKTAILLIVDDLYNGGTGEIPAAAKARLDTVRAYA